MNYNTRPPLFQFTCTTIVSKGRLSQNYVLCGIYSNIHLASAFAYGFMYRLCFEVYQVYVHFHECVVCVFSSFSHPAPVFVLKLKSDKATLGINTQTKSLKVCIAWPAVDVGDTFTLSNNALQVFSIIYQSPPPQPNVRGIRHSRPFGGNEVFNILPFYIYNYANIAPTRRHKTQS